MVSRAARRLRDERPRFSASREAARDLALRFGEAARTGDYDALLSLLAEDAACATDGGGKVIAARNVIRGADRVARFVLGVTAKGATGADLECVTVNGAPGWVLSRGGTPFAVATIEISDGQIDKVLVIVNPDKLARVRRPRGVFHTSR